MNLGHVAGSTVGQIPRRSGPHRWRLGRFLPNGFKASCLWGCSSWRHDACAPPPREPPEQIGNSGFERPGGESDVRGLDGGLSLLVRKRGCLWAFQAYVVATFSASTVWASLMPDIDRKGNYSDGARVLMLLKNDELAARWLAVLQLEMQLGQGTHPRDWDKAALVRADHQQR